MNTAQMIRDAIVRNMAFIAKTPCFQLVVQPQADGTLEVGLYTSNNEAEAAMALVYVWAGTYTPLAPRPSITTIDFLRQLEARLTYASNTHYPLITAPARTVLDYVLGLLHAILTGDAQLDDVEFVMGTWG